MVRVWRHARWGVSGSWILLCRVTYCVGVENKGRFSPRLILPEPLFTFPRTQTDAIHSQTAHALCLLVHRDYDLHIAGRWDG